VGDFEVAAGVSVIISILRDGVSEIRIDEGAGYRVYYAQIEQVVVLLLCGGDKSTQDADINRAVANWEEFQRRRKEGRA
jgi:putative addiction module killer protein